MPSMTEEQYAAHMARMGRVVEKAREDKTPVRPQKGANKYGAVRTEIDGITFDSKKEAGRYEELKLLQAAGEIHSLCADKRRLAFCLDVNNVRCGYYEADFSFVVSSTGERVFEDSKSPATRTDVYILKKKLVFALHGVEIKEV